MKQYSFSEAQTRIQSILNSDNYEAVLTSAANDLINKKRVSDNPELEELQMKILIDCLEACEKNKFQTVYVDFLIKKLTAGLLE